MECPTINSEEVEVALKGMKHGKIFEQEKRLTGENARGMEGQCDCTNLQREGGHPGLWELQRHQDDTHTMKIWERIIDRRLREETSIGEEQFGFMPGRGTTDAIFAARQLI